MTFKDVAISIVQGELDNDLQNIIEIVNERKVTLNRVKFFSFASGDKIRFVNEARPTYLAGATGVIRELRNKNVVVDLDVPTGRYSKGIVTPVSLIEKI